MKKKKIVLWVVGAIFALTVLGVIVAALSSNSPVVTSEPAASAPADIKVGTKAGIGDTEKRWEKDYRELKGDDPVRNLKVNGSDVAVVFMDNHAVNITIGKRDKYYENSAIKDMLPADKTETKKEKDTSDPMLIKDRISYHSDILEKAYPETKGNFIVINTSDATTKAYINTVIDCTPTPN